MCLEALAVGLTLAGTAASAKAASDTGAAENSAANAELQRQAQFQQQGKQLFNQSLGQSTPQVAKQQLQQGTNQALQQYQNIQSIPLTNQPTTAEQTTRNQLFNQSAAPLQGYNNFSMQQAIQNLLAQQNLGVVSGNAQASAGVLPLELQQAAQSQQGLAGLGSLLSSAGGLAGIYGAYNGGGLFGKGSPWFSGNGVGSTGPFGFATPH